MDKQKRRNKKGVDRKKIYFFTLCTDKRAPLFGTVIQGKNGITLSPSPLGIKAASLLKRISTNRRDITLTDYRIMPNHIHFLVSLHSDDNRRIDWFVTYCRQLLERQAHIEPVISATDSLVQEIPSEQAYRTACHCLESQYDHWHYDRLYVSEENIPYGASTT